MRGHRSDCKSNLPPLGGPCDCGYDQWLRDRENFHKDTLHEKIQEQDLEIDALRTIALLTEWGDEGALPSCPLCKEERHNGHKGDCPYTEARKLGFMR